MKRGKLIAGILWLILGALIVMGLLCLIQQMMISGTKLMNELGGMEIIEDAAAQTTPEPTAYLTEDDFDYEGPIVTIEPEELFSIPVEETAEELAKENEGK